MSKDINKVYLTAERKAGKNKSRNKVACKNLSLMLIQETPNSIKVSETHIPIGTLSTNTQ